MNRKIPILVATVAVTAALGLSAYAAAGQDTTWAKIGEGYYTGMPAAGQTVVLQRALTDKDYEEIQEQMVDTARAPDLISAEKAKNDPDIVLPDNMLPDGRFLKENWMELERQLVEERQNVLVKDQDGAYQTGASQAGKKASVTLDAKAALSLQTEQIKVGNETVLLPKAAAGSMLASAAMPDGKNVVAYSEQEMWIVSGQEKTAKLAVPNTYQGKSYDALVEESFNKYEENAVLWCGQVTPAPDSKKIAYAANKNDLDGGYSVFLYDMDAGTEQLVRPGNGYFYLIAGWVDEDNILCYKIKDDTRTFVVVGTDGSETPLRFAAPDAQLIATKAGLIAYTNAANDTVYVGRYQGTEDLAAVYQGSVGGSLRLRTDVNEFNADATKLALVYVPDEGPYKREVKVFDLTESGEKKVSLPRSAKGARNNVLEVSWTNDGGLLVVAEATDGAGAPSYSTWQYNEEEAKG